MSLHKVCQRKANCINNRNMIKARDEFTDYIN